MSDIETLLSVDKGRIPPGTMAFFLADAEATVARTHWALAATTAVAAVACAGAGAGRFLVALLVLAAAGLALLAWPTLSEEEARPAKRQVLVVTGAGLIVRDEWGLRNWQFENLAGVLTGHYAGHPHLVLIERNGTRHAVNHLKFQGGSRLHEVLDARLRRMCA